MISGVPLFRGRDNQDQLLHIMRIIGTPDDRTLRKIATEGVSPLTRTPDGGLLIFAAFSKLKVKGKSSIPVIRRSPSNKFSRRQDLKVVTFSLSIFITLNQCPHSGRPTREAPSI